MGYGKLLLREFPGHPAEDGGDQRKPVARHGVDVVPLLALSLGKGLDLRELKVQGADMVKKQFAEGRKMDAPGGAHKQFSAQLILETADRRGQHGPGNKQLICRRADGPCLYNFDHIVKLLYRHGTPPFLPLDSHEQNARNTVIAMVPGHG